MVQKCFNVTDQLKKTFATAPLCLRRYSNLYLILLIGSTKFLLVQDLFHAIRLIKIQKCYFTKTLSIYKDLLLAKNFDIFMNPINRL